MGIDSVINGTATGGSMTSLVDSTKVWQTNMWQNYIAVILHDGQEYDVVISSNSAGALAFSAIGATIEPGDTYSIKASNLTALAGSIAAQFGQLAIDNTAGGIALTPALYGTHKRALITVETAQIRFRLDGGVPTSTVGHILNPGDTITLDSNSDITNFRAIRTGTLSGLITATYGD